MIRKFLLAIFISVCSLSAHAAQIDTANLSEQQIAEIKAQAAAMAANNAKANDPASTVSAGMTLAATWGTQAASAAEGFAKALGIAAKELNIGINAFLDTDAGKITAALIIWKVAGASIINVLLGITVMISGLVFARVIYLRLFSAGYEKVPYSRLFGMFTGEKMVPKRKSFQDLKNDGEWLVLWILIITVVATFLFSGAILT